ncbi:UTP--glucose-1-phosphate uridylyltransferase [SAR202 cluster bacterium AD-802-E10_MRT_200m]|nr:UTP--glucose-1-phosphate uridylyltransferase [SAR202 cluster bacterium AD-802-E10_MRT_200m]
MQVRKAIIPAAGLGTRMLPTSKAVPKELLPLIDRPMIQYIIEEAVSSGITEIIIITSPGKEALQTYFTPDPKLDLIIAQKDEGFRLASLNYLTSHATFSYVIQTEQLGLGHAVLTASNTIGNEPFAVMLPDDIIWGHPPALGQLIEHFDSLKSNIIAVEKIPKEITSSYGIIEPKNISQNLYEIIGMQEKPPLEEAASNLGIVGRYILTQEIFAALQQVNPGKNGEIQLTDAIALLLKTQKVFGYEFSGKRYDTGNPMGHLQAVLGLALTRDDIPSSIKNALIESVLSHVANSETSDFTN